MKLYHIFNRYYGTQAEARAGAKENDVKFVPEDDTVEVPTDKEGLIGYLNKLSSTMRCGGGIFDDPVEADQFTTVVERQDPPVDQPERADPLAFDDAWESMPLARKAHFAALFCEEVRGVIPKLVMPNAETRAAMAALNVDQVYETVDEMFADIEAEDDELFA